MGEMETDLPRQRSNGWQPFLRFVKPPKVFGDDWRYSRWERVPLSPPEKQAINSYLREGRRGKQRKEAREKRVCREGVSDGNKNARSGGFSGKAGSCLAE
jgi:hypothetical protein